MEVGLEVIRYILPAIIVLIITYLMLSMFMKNEEKRRMHEIRLNSRQNSLPIRLQAYERLALFLERIQPANLMVRIKTEQMNVSGYQAILIQTIRTEYEYNLSQQIYVSSNAWKMIKGARDRDCEPDQPGCQETERGRFGRRSAFACAAGPGCKKTQSIGPRLWRSSRVR